MNPHFYAVGDARVAKVVDCELDLFTPEKLLPNWSEEDCKLLDSLPGSVAPDSGRLLLSIHSWVILHRGKTIIVDTGAGNDKPRPYAPYFDHIRTPYLDRLRATGIEREDVDYVLHTHLHVDHVGWNTMLVDGRWVPTFPNARHVFSAKEYAYFIDRANLNERNLTSFQVQQDSVMPIVEAGMAEMIDIKGDEVIAGFAFHPTPGHTVDHASIVFESAGEQALFAGDVLHHPVQVLKPELLSILDPGDDPTLASRHWALNRAVDTGAIWFSSHFPSTSAGHVVRTGSSYDWKFS